MWPRFVSDRLKSKIFPLSGSKETASPFDGCMSTNGTAESSFDDFSNFKRVILEDRKALWNRIAILEEQVKIISGFLNLDKSCPQGFSKHDDNLPNSASGANGFEDHVSANDVMVEIQGSGLTSGFADDVTIETEDSHFGCDGNGTSDEVDKTGFKQVKLRALQKVAQFWPSMTGGITIGPEPTHNANELPEITSFGHWSPIGKSDHHSTALETPQPQGAIDRGQTASMKCARSIQDKYDNDEEILVDEEKLCHRKILSELNNLGLHEAQEAKFRRLKEWEEHDKRGREEQAHRTALRQQENLKRQQAKMHEMARMRAEEMKRHEEFMAQQALREMEHCRRQEETRKQQMEAEKLLNEKISRKRALFEKLYECHQNFSSQYRDILELLKAHEELKSAIADDLEVMKTCNEQFCALTSKSKLQQITEDVVAKAYELLDVAISLNTKARNELVKIEDVKKKELEQVALKKKEEMKNRIKEKKLEQEKQLSAISHEGNFLEKSPRFQEYLSLQKNFENIEQSLEGFMADNNLKRFRSDCQKAINIPVNAISAQNSAHLYDKYKKLSSFLQKQTVVISEKRITSATHPLGPLYSLNYLAAKIVKQGELAVSSNPEAAYPVASVVVALWTQMPEFGKLLLSQFYKASPYLIPSYWERKENEPEEEYYKRLGFLYSGGEREELDKFLKRQSGIMRLYCAIIVSPQNKANRNQPHPLPISEAWNWMTSFISLPPKVDISATLVLELLEITGDMMMSSYKAQFRKLLHVLCISYLPAIDKVTPVGRKGPVTRLRGFLEGLISGKNIPPPKGLLSPNFW